MSGFDADTALTEVGEGHWRAEVSERWFVERGPNGGLFAAQAARAMIALAGDAVREPRSLTVHYLEAAAAGPVEVRGTVERAGRTTTAVDLTIHWRAAAPALPADGWVLGAFRWRRIAGGSFEEDGRLWSRDGVLLAQSRQLALLRERPPP